MHCTLYIYHCITAAVDLTTATAGEKSTRKSRAKEPFAVTFDESVDMDSHFKQKRAAITVTAVTLEKHSHIKTTLPEDLHYNETQISQLFLMPTVTVRRFYSHGWLTLLSLCAV